MSALAIPRARNPFKSLSQRVMKTKMRTMMKTLTMKKMLTKKTEKKVAMTKVPMKKMMRQRLTKLLLSQQRSLLVTFHSPPMLKP